MAKAEIHGSALAVVLTGLITSGLTVSPAEASLQPSQNQQFKAESKNGRPVQPTWSVYSAAGNVGSIDAGGNYTAPDTITRPLVAVVSAVFKGDFGAFAATAIVHLQPSADA